MDELLEGLLDLSRAGATSLTSRLAGQLRSLISEGHLKSGRRLPSSRALAARLNVSRNTVTQAIEQLAAEGYLDVSQSRRPVVAAGASLLTTRQRGDVARDVSARPRLSAWGRKLAKSNWPPVYRDLPRPFQPGLADEREFPRDIWGRCLRHAANRRFRWSNFTVNDPTLQDALLKHLATHRGISARAEQIIVVPSAQAALTLIARVMIDVGDVAWIESPGYSGAYAASFAAGAKVVGVPIDADGLRIASNSQPPKIIFVTPSHQYPTGKLMPIGCRLELLRFARSVGAAIIEDDYDGEFHYEGRPVAALAAIDPDALVFYVGTFAKSMSADIRVGYVIVPQSMAPTFVLAQRHLGLLAAATLQSALAEFIERGTYLSHLRRMTRLYGDRRDCLVRVLAEEAGRRLAVDVPAGGMQLLVRYVGPTDDRSLSRRLLEAGVVTRPLSEMLHHRSRERGLFLGFAAWTEAELTAGARLIGRHIR
ncbi:PLP-dependent aminotransferase family protein [Bradyrhizobium sp. LHD-71]|uniref:MocR-like pyridoxine biosynthesis transcription factor PdxR n=1 Tax=Bradyrhizobium sp. LHD-71 TaxID=3072141 RepID=UPI00280C9FC4|nr:PLP-dependent aminotransferase family protein [Bradyrhizobium sp. LHD-71]MDQ8727228.1 PLP-dependent aminotransferase family protein [Bradyrhizobium sp. LHD-71]